MVRQKRQPIIQSHSRQLQILQEGNTMYKVECLKDYGCWSKTGKITELNNALAKNMERKGIVRIIEYTGNGWIPNTIPKLQKAIEKNKERITKIQTINKKYEKIIQEMKKC